MTKREYLYTVLSEEAAEVGQAVSKILRFGNHAYNPLNNTITENADALLEEVQHLQAAVEMLQEAGYLPLIHKSLSLDEIKHQKKVKVQTYLDDYLNFTQNCEDTLP